MLNIITDVLVYYGIFAFATGITSYFSIYRPILREISHIVPEALEITQPITTALALITISTALAPVLFKMALFGPTIEFVETYIDQVVNPDDE